MPQFWKFWSFPPLIQQIWQLFLTTNISKFQFHPIQKLFSPAKSYTLSILSLLKEFEMSFAEWRVTQVYAEKGQMKAVFGSKIGPW